MTIRYKITSTSKPGAGKDGEKIYFPRLTGSSPVDLDYLSRIIEQRSSASKADVYLILLEFAQLVPELLTEGKTIVVKDLGSFQLHARVSAADSPEKVTFRNIKEIRMSFLPDKKIKKRLNKINFQRQG